MIGHVGAVSSLLSDSRRSSVSHKASSGMTAREWLDAAVEWKADADADTLIGYAAVFGNIDSGGDRIKKGAFAKTIQERVAAGLVPLLDSHTWDAAHTIGTVVSAQEDDDGLLIRARLSTAPSVQDLKAKLVDGTIRKMSIGYVPVKESWEKLADGRVVRNLEEIKLLEVSVVPLAMNEATRIVAVKGMMPFADLPLAPEDTPWDPDAARFRVLQWAGGIKNLDPNKYRQAFVWYNRDADTLDQLDAFRLPIADVIDGKLMAVPSAIHAAAREADGPIEREHLARYFAKMGTPPPWVEAEEAARRAAVIEHIRQLAAELPEGQRKAIEAAIAATGEPADRMPLTGRDGTTAHATGEPRDLSALMARVVAEADAIERLRGA